MVKPDAKQDYYADLEVAPGASADEIKKQFRKLGTTYFVCCVFPNLR